MLGRWSGRRRAARAAVVGLAFGLTALIALTVWATWATQQTAARVRSFNEVNSHWSSIFVELVQEDAALRSYLETNGSDLMRQPLAESAGSADGDIVWLENHGDPVEADHVRMVRSLYTEYTGIVAAVLSIDPADETGALASYRALADLSYESLRDEVVANLDRNQRQLAAFLLEADRRGTTLRWIAVGIGGIDLALCAVSAWIILAYQHRAECEARRNHHEASHDTLTGLANRQLLAGRTTGAIAEARRCRTATALLLVDLDRFKEVNDTLGHYSGDLLLRRVAARLLSVVRDGDTVARLGGDEFAVLLGSVAGSEEVAEQAERIRQSVLQPVELNGLIVDVGASIGVSVFPTDAATPEEMLQHADIAMYVAKRGGFGVSVYDARNDVHNPMTLSMLSELRYGIGHGELVLYYQPKVDLAGQDMKGVEVLVRWLHPSRGLIAPDAFLPLIDRTDLIGQLTDEVLEMALGQASDWAAAGQRIPVAVNITARSLLDTTFPGKVAEALEKFGIPARQLTLELTESALITDPDRAADVLRRLRVQGIRVSIDDFGTGYSSMAFLRDMPVHELKIDRSFVTTMRTDERNHAIVKAIVDLARNLTLDVVAEGVEDRATLESLADLGCTVAQGYHISRPLPADGFDQWLRLRR